MQQFLSNIQIKVNDYLFLKDPSSSELGKRIISGSVELMHEIGFEAFTFKKLAKEINSTEASIYRYFENKNKVLLYLTIWFWGWTESKLVFAITNVEDKELKLKKAITIITEDVLEDRRFKDMNERKLQKVVYDESAKAYINKLVDDENKNGVFANYKSVIQRVSDIILEINPDYPYPKMLVSTIIEGTHLQRFFVDHLPGLTSPKTNSDSDVVQEFFIDLAFKTIKT
ncbi:TetR/AcrR family transcriptional regulator [Brumimicrobium glaciale]|uniref:TetR/AcrR family transcriptional regulator n=1 Tax=Brumimicrobium glaciale TaxID=200475 RepID=A0A4Q4KR79_9FLAO|nr:helix-turn-helix domain-containing protein [Brumimicrobium glaciale]RYM35114.1 TetR/AcrR family transcriptional regulator [Brumimicrobium glaciale]